MSTPQPVYLDFNATAPVRPAAMAAMAEALSAPGNASSVHAFGRTARRRLEAARRTVADAVGAFPDEVVFTSGGTEANNLALGAIDGGTVVSAIEHPSVLEAAPGAWRIPAGRDGRIDLAALASRLQQGAPRLVSVMLANNETGVIQPVSEAAAIAHRHGAVLHVDAAQGLGRIAVERDVLGADLLTLSAHKLGGPPGAGALIVRRGVELRPQLRGGGQELRRRAGTEPLPAILGFAAAVAAIGADEPAQQARLREKLEDNVGTVCEKAFIVGSSAPRLPNTSCIVLPEVDASLQLMRLDLAGVAVSSGAACSSGKVAPSHVLLAMTLDEASARCAIRVSLGWSSAETDVWRFLEAWGELLRDLGSRQGPCAGAAKADIHGQRAGGVARWAGN